MTTHILNSRTALYYMGINQLDMAKVIEDELRLMRPDIIIDAHLMALGQYGQIETSFGTIEPGEVIVHAPFIQGINGGLPLRSLALSKDTQGVLREYGYVERRENTNTRAETVVVRSGFLDYDKASREARSSGKSPYCVVRTFTPSNIPSRLNVSMWTHTGPR